MRGVSLTNWVIDVKRLYQDPLVRPLNLTKSLPVTLRFSGNHSRQVPEFYTCFPVLQTYMLVDSGAFGPHGM